VLPPLVSQLLQVQPSDNPEVIHLRRELSWAHLKIQVLEERLRKQRIDKYGPASESLTNKQLELLEDEPGVSAEEVAVEAGRDPQVLEVKTRPGKRERRPHPGRQALPEGLPRVERLVSLPEAQCNCGACGKVLAVIGYESSEQLDVEPAKYIVRVTRREKRACRHCGEAGVKTASATARIVEKSLVSDRVIVDTVIAKYCDHVPLYRQSAMLERDAGVEIHRATMDGWVMQVGELLRPVANVMLRNLVSGSYLQADETPVDVQVRNGKGKNHQAYLWQYSRPGGEAVFEFQMGRGREGPEKVLQKFEGILQTDGYQVYNKVGGEKLVQAACWAHARRKFFDAVKVSPKDAAAIAMVDRMDAVFAVDAEARELSLALEQRHELRLKKMQPLVLAMETELKRLSREVLPASALGQAVNYTLSLWARLQRVLDHPELELSTNLAENSMRGIALGRKNWIHVGSPVAGPKVAAILSVLESCRRLRVPVREYLLEVLPGLGRVNIRDLDSRTPAGWLRHQKVG